MNILDNFRRIFLGFPTFGVRSSIDVLDQENQSRAGSGALELTEDVWQQKYEIKKEAFNIIWNIHLIEFRNLPSFKVKSTGSSIGFKLFFLFFLAKNWIQIPWF